MGIRKVTRLLGCLALLSVLFLLATGIVQAIPPKERLCQELFPTGGCPNGSCTAGEYTTGPCIIYGCNVYPNLVICW
jgi:hypothetical protein